MIDSVIVVSTNAELVVVVARKSILDMAMMPSAMRAMVVMSMNMIFHTVKPEPMYGVVEMMVMTVRDE